MPSDEGIELELLSRSLPRTTSSKNVTVLVVDEDGKSHKFPADAKVLCESSKIFARKLQGNAATNGHRAIQIDDVGPRMLKNILLYIHTETHEISSYEDGLQLLEAALKLEIISLVDECQTMMSQKMNLQNVCQLYAMSRGHELLKPLEESSESLILRTAVVLLKTQDFRNLPIGAQRELLSSDQLCIESEVWLQKTLASLDLIHQRCPSGVECLSCLASVIRRPIIPEGRSSFQCRRPQRLWNPHTAPRILKYCERWRLTSSDWSHDGDAWKCRKISGCKKPCAIFTTNRPVYMYGYVLTVLETKKIRDFRMTIWKREEEEKEARRASVPATEGRSQSQHVVRVERIMDSSFVRLTFEMHHPVLITIGAHCSLYFSNGNSSSVLPVVGLPQKRFYLDCAVATVLSEEVYGLNCVYFLSAA